jgi:orotidine-5'-phosphate decarboxylase
MSQNPNYLRQLMTSSTSRKSIICFGLDPIPETFPGRYSTPVIEAFPLMVQELVRYLKEQGVFPGAFKPNLGYYTKYDNPREKKFTGQNALADVINILETELPDIPVILDYKKGDIGKSSENYALDGLLNWNASAVTVAPYMGTDSIMPFAKYCGTNGDVSFNKGVYVLNLTSNPGRQDFEEILTAKEKPLYMQVAEWIRKNAQQHVGLGAVVGAPSLEGLKNIASFYRENTMIEVPLLIPGVGGQGGKADEVVKVLRDVGYNMGLVRINVSSGLTHPWGTEKPPEDWKKVIADTLFKLNKETGMA